LKQIFSIFLLKSSPVFPLYSSMQSSDAIGATNLRNEMKKVLNLIFHLDSIFFSSFSSLVCMSIYRLELERKERQKSFQGMRILREKVGHNCALYRMRERGKSNGQCELSIKMKSKTLKSSHMLSCCYI
jgi:hypothetical protein